MNGDGWPDPITGISMRQPPANLEAEQAVLGALLSNNRAYDRVAEFLRPEHFADAVHAQIYTAIQRRLDAGQVADAVTLRADFDGTGVLDAAGGVGYLAQLLMAMVGIINTGEYGRVIEDLWLRRQIIEAGEVAINAAFGAEVGQSAQDILEAADTALLGLASGRGVETARPGAVVADAAMAQMMAAVHRRGALAGVTWGFRGLDRMTGGLRPGQLVLLGARPSMGKTSMALEIALSAARAGHRVLFISAEMMAEEIMKRAIAGEARIPLGALTTGAVRDAGHPQGWRPLDADDPMIQDAALASVRLGQLPIVWDDGAFTVASIRARARRMQRQPGGLSLIVVDYLGRLRASSAAARQSNAAMAAVGEISGGLKDLAMQLGVPVLLLSQLNRQVEAREDKTPQLSDLRDSGALEQDADIVAFLYRAHYYLARSEPRRRANEKAADFEERSATWLADVARERGRATVIIAKQRQGPIGPVRVRFDDDTAQFRDEGPGEGGGD